VNSEFFWQKKLFDAMSASLVIVEGATFLVWSLLSLIDVFVIYLCEPVVNIGGKVHSVDSSFPITLDNEIDSYIIGRRDDSKAALAGQDRETETCGRAWVVIRRIVSTICSWSCI
jgi:hypothetical protein